MYPCVEFFLLVVLVILIKQNRKHCADTSHRNVYESATNELPLTAIKFVSSPLSPTDNRFDDSNHHDTLWTMYRIDVRPRISLLATNERPLSCLCIPQAIIQEQSPQKPTEKLGNRFPSTNSLSTTASVSATPDKIIKLKLWRQNTYPQFDQTDSMALAFRDNRLPVADSRLSFAAATPLSSLSSMQSNQTTNQINDQPNIIVKVLPKSQLIATNILPRILIPTSSLLSIACAATATTTITTTLTSTAATMVTDTNNTTHNLSLITAKMPPIPSTKPIKFLSITNTLTTTTTTTATTTTAIIPHPYIVKHNSDTTPNSSNSSAVRRQRHSIAGQMSYFKMLGFGGYSKKMATSTNSLFSTAVISGSSSAPNLRDMIPCTASSSGKY